MEPHERLAVEFVAREEGRKIIAIVRSYCKCGNNEQCLMCGGSGIFEYALAMVPNDPDGRMVKLQYSDGAVNVWSYPGDAYLYSVFPGDGTYSKTTRTPTGPFSELREVK